MENMPLYLPVLFRLITIAAIFIFYKATQSKIALIIMLTWIIIQSIIALTGFYKITGTIPPRFAILIVPPVILIFVLAFSTRGRNFINRIDLKTLTWIHTLRIPVEFVLYGLFIYKAIPQIMTFEGRNWDIFSGISAPFIIYLGFRHGRINRKLLLAWNIISLALLINIVSIALFTSPFPFRTVPFIWLPCCVVPLVLMAHIVAIRRLLTNPQKSLARMQHSF